jgi:hypothetical protein
MLNNMLSFHRVLIILLFQFVHPRINSQDTLLHTVVSEVREGKYSEKRELLAKTTVPLDVLSKLSPYLSDTAAYTRSAIINIVFNIYEKNLGSKEVRVKTVEVLLHGCGDQDEGVRQLSYPFLLKFSKNDFSEQERKIIKKLQAFPSTNDNLLLLYGVANLKKQKKILKKIASDTSYCFNCTAWNAQLALARMGSTEHIENCIRKINRIKDVDDRVIYYSNDLGYMRSEKSIKILIDYLFSDNKISTDYGDVMKTPHACYTFSHLSDCIENFPRLTIDDCLEKNITIARKWIIEHPNYKIRK